MREDIWQRHWPREWPEPQPWLPPLQAAIREGRWERVRELLRQGCSPNQFAETHGVYFTPLHMALMYHQPQCALWLLEAGAQANCEVFRDAEPTSRSYFNEDAWSMCPHGLTALDLAILTLQPVLILPLLRAGARPGRRAYLYRDKPEYREAVARLDHEMGKIRALEAAEEQLNQTGQNCHRRVLFYLARGQQQRALDEAGFAFRQYQQEGRYREALQVTREMHRIDPESVRPYELRVRFLLELGRPQEAEVCQEELVAFHLRRGDWVEARASMLRFDLLRRGLGQRWEARPRVPLLARPAFPESSEGGRNLPALAE